MNGSDENKPKRPNDKPLHKGVPDLRDFMNKPAPGSEKEEVDIQSLMSEIRRVPSSRAAAKPQEPRRDAPQQQSVPQKPATQPVQKPEAPHAS